MRPVERAPRDPSPSRLAWRYERLMLTPGVRFLLKVCAPLSVVGALGAWWLSDAAHQQQIKDGVAALKASIEARPEFTVHMMAIDGASTQTDALIRETLALDFPQSSFDLDLPSLRETIRALPPVEQATVHIRPGGILQVDVTARQPVAIWHRGDGLSLIDKTGVSVAHIALRSARSDLPLLAGAGVDDALAEGLALVHAATPLADRLVGLVRVSERRWDLLLDRDQRILLPEFGALQALEHVIALDGADDVLSRDIERVDMRLSARPTVKMSPSATREWRRIKKLERNGL